MRIADQRDTLISLASDDGDTYITLGAYTITDSPADDLVVHECAFTGEEGWRVSCKRTGFAVTKPNPTREGALRDLEQIAHTYGQYFAAELDRRREKTTRDRIERATARAGE